MITLIRHAEEYGERTAVIDEHGSYNYHALLAASAGIGGKLLNGRSDLNEARVAFLVQPGFDYVCLQWGIWRAGGIAVPLCTKHPLASIEYAIRDTTAECVIYASEFTDLLSPLFGSDVSRFIALPDMQTIDVQLPDIDLARRAMILYTSGTTGKPKGVVSTHGNIRTQITTLVTSWEWQADDHILNVLPLHHVHGIINVMSCALFSGACCQFLPKFDPARVFDIFLEGRVTVFMAVPTIYFKLIAHWEASDQARQQQISLALNKFRLMISGSAALPVSVMGRWREISGHTLLERYGMTEMGMAISNSYRHRRIPGHVGLPLRDVMVRLVDEGHELVAEGSPGEIQVKGPNVFKEYWGKPDTTTAAFTADGWFKTGDIAVFENGAYRILGRNSVDIIKSGGYKISALEIEEVLRRHPAIEECGVVGVPDEEWGEVVCASIIPKEQNQLSAEGLREWLKDKLPSYQMPRHYRFDSSLPRNVMGKVTKKAIQAQFKPLL